eukprot:CAMPEP_0113846092 /NCGR_PEP_ID=MMETSP0372-20130328/1117_1 /TAXON_ID=340204 /ORGANISM="Lankesteria abbotti" /LENGTH=132 /DNA_ID=CAMNT_0000815201 /DNA_START=801 /DNA_END=1196 /DNA_ORIENTATION=+ /assembly_acc=CAM_ASM_000359
MSHVNREVDEGNGTEQAVAATTIGATLSGVTSIVGSRQTPIGASTKTLETPNGASTKTPETPNGASTETPIDFTSIFGSPKTPSGSTKPPSVFGSTKPPSGGTEIAASTSRGIAASTSKCSPTDLASLDIKW